MFYSLIHGHAPLLVGLVAAAIGAFVTPGMMILIALVFESRWMPLGYRKQFLSFFPGDLVLSVAFGILVAAETYVKPGWYTDGLFGTTAILVGVVLGDWFTLYFDPRTKDYAPRAMKSPTKIYHNYFVYGVYGAAIATTVFADFFGGAPAWFWLSFAIGVPFWALFLFIENRIPAKGWNKIRAQHCHVGWWAPIWQTGRIRRS